MKTSHLVLGALATAFSLSAFAQSTVTTEAARLGEPMQNTGTKPSVSDSSTQGQALDTSLYSGA